MLRSIRLVCVFLVAVSSVVADEWPLNQGAWTLVVSDQGGVVSLREKDGPEFAVGRPDGSLPAIGAAGAAPAVGWRGDHAAMAALGAPTKASRTGSAAVFEYELREPAALRLRYEVALAGQSEGVVVRRQVTLTPAAEPIRQDIVLLLGSNLAPPGEKPKVFVPRKDGIGGDVAPGPAMQWIWPLAGEVPSPNGVAEHLAIPMVSQSAGDPARRVTHVADPFFATRFRLADAKAGHPGDFACIYLGSKVPITGAQTRTFWTVVQTGGPENAMKAWYATALADVPPGPDWLHEVAWQHYDYLSHGGKGWFEDIDVAETMVPRADRSKVVFTLHGWYGLLGEYGGFDIATGRLADEWTAFSNAAAMKDKGFPTLEPVRMSKGEMRRRIRYAKDRGFRICLYFADGLTACDAAKVFAPDKVLTWGGWQGPDTIGKSYCQNPAHPAVYRWFLAYLKALLADYGDEIDALVWDETFMIRDGAITPGPESDYAGPHFMRLCRDLARLVTAHRKELAFLNSDCIGATFDDKAFWLDVPPYAIMVHGCYQDTHSRPNVWPFGIFPNYRNVLWSCNWAAVSHFDYTRFGVEHYDTPVATSNGWIDDKGLARLTGEQRKAVLDLFNARKTRRQQLRWLTGPPPVLTTAPAH